MSASTSRVTGSLSSSARSSRISAQKGAVSAPNLELATWLAKAPRALCARANFA